MAIGHLHYVLSRDYVIGVGRGQTYVWRGSGSTFSAHATWATGAPVLCRTVDPDGLRKSGRRSAKTYVWRRCESVTRPRGTGATGALVSCRTTDPDGGAHRSAEGRWQKGRGTTGAGSALGERMSGVGAVRRFAHARRGPREPSSHAVRPAPTVRRHRRVEGRLKMS